MVTDFLLAVIGFGSEFGCSTVLANALPRTCIKAQNPLQAS
jgi:hypothetical protein